MGESSPGAWPSREQRLKLCGKAKLAISSYPPTYAKALLQVVFVARFCRGLGTKNTTTRREKYKKQGSKRWSTEMLSVVTLCDTKHRHKTTRRSAPGVSIF